MEVNKNNNKPFTVPRTIISKQTILLIIIIIVLLKQGWLNTAIFIINKPIFKTLSL